MEERKKNLCAMIPESLHKKVREEQEEWGIKLNEYMERILKDHFEKGEREMANGTQQRLPENGSRTTNLMVLSPPSSCAKNKRYHGEQNPHTVSLRYFQELCNGHCPRHQGYLSSDPENPATFHTPKASVSGSVSGSQQYIYLR